VKQVRYQVSLRSFTMGLTRPVIRTVVVMTLLVAVGYVLRPVAWELEAKLHDAKEIFYRAGENLGTFSLQNVRRCSAVGPFILR
jgi:hypothetical protein